MYAKFHEYKVKLGEKYNLLLSYYFGSEKWLSKCFNIFVAFLGVCFFFYSVGAFSYYFNTAPIVSVFLIILFLGANTYNGKNISVFPKSVRYTLGYCLTALTLYYLANVKHWTEFELGVILIPVWVTMIRKIINK